MNEPTPFEISFSEDGTYSITALIKDNQNNEIYSTKKFLGIIRGSKSSSRSPTLELIQDKSIYSVGEEVTIMLESPLQKTRGWVYTVARPIINRIYFEIEDGKFDFYF